MFALELAVGIIYGVGMFTLADHVDEDRGPIFWLVFLGAFGVWAAAQIMRME